MTYLVCSGPMKETVEADSVRAAFAAALNQYEGESLGLITKIQEVHDGRNRRALYFSTEAQLKRLGMLQ